MKLTDAEIKEVLYMVFLDMYDYVDFWSSEDRGRSWFLRDKGNAEITLVDMKAINDWHLRIVEAAMSGGECSLDKLRTIYSMVNDAIRYERDNMETTGKERLPRLESLSSTLKAMIIDVIDEQKEEEK